MNRSLPEIIQDILSCPCCGEGVTRTGSGFACNGCGSVYPCNKGGQIDFRLQKSKTVSVDFELGKPLPDGNEMDFLPLKMNINPELDFTVLKIPFHLTRELMSYFPRARNGRSLILDLGCGDAIHREICEKLGFTYIGVDHDNPNATFLADAHSLPFKNESFEFILSVAVLEHIQYPFVMAREVLRILETGGAFIGTVAFLEPFHGDSFYHHTHIGTYNTLKSAGFDIQHIAPSNKWMVLQAQATMGLFPKMPFALSKALVFPLHLLSIIWWKLGSLVNKKASYINWVNNMAGAFSFIARKH